MSSLLAKAVLLLAVGILDPVQPQKDGYTDENRPYEFGFVIEGEQHRYEKKDEKGIIMGEYGFITADGVYHVTVYATDEDGNFRILKTKNIRIGLKMIQPTTTTTTPKPAVGKFSGLSGCSGCLIPTTLSPKTAEAPFAGGINQGQFQGVGKGQLSTNSRVQSPQIQNGRGPSVGPSPSNANSPLPGSTASPIVANVNSIQPTLGGPGSKLPGLGSHQISGKEVSPGPNKFRKTPGVASTATGPRNEGLNFSNKPSLSGPNNQNVGQKTLSETEKNIMNFMARLYKFNYTLSFHGHEEEGDIEGRKRGSYFNNGRDGFQRKVEYLANEFGYQPKITLVNLDPAATPNEKTEKDLTQLLGNEFIWFYDKSKV